MRIIYCDSVFDNKVIDSDYESEKDSAIKAGFDLSLISFEELTSGNTIKSLRLIKETETMELGFYRGWMLRPEQYEKLYEGLLDKNIRLINNPQEYKHCHYLPESYEKIKSDTSKSNWITDLVIERILEKTLEVGIVR